jgi:uncharacterized membrane protein
MIPPGLIHVAAAAVALGAGAALFAGRKGTMRHRRLGFLYLGAMAYVNLAAWSVDTRGAIGPFHVLTVLSVATLVGAYVILLTGRRSRGRSEAHGTMMAWSYAGVLAAGLGQGAAATDLSVGVVIGATLLAAGLLIHVARPRVLTMSSS